MAQLWEYNILSIPTVDQNPAAGWIATAGPHFERMGSDGWECVLVLKHEQGFAHVLFKRSKEGERSGVVW